MWQNIMDAIGNYIQKIHALRVLIGIHAAGCHAPCIRGVTMLMNYFVLNKKDTTHITHINIQELILGKS